MSRQSRATLKAYFLSGKRPTEEDFADLIDSSLNINDEGFRKTPPDGLRVKSLGDSPALLSFYTARAQDDASAEWRIAFGEDFKKLSVENPGARTPLITLDPKARLGVGTTEPQDVLDVAGTVRSEGRRGQSTPGLIADGRYHPLTGPLHGLQAIEVMAGVGLPQTGRFSLMHAIALNTFNPIWWDDLPFFRKKTIRAQHAYYSRGADRLQLRWAPVSDKVTSGHGEKATYRLEIRTRRDYLAGRRARGELKPGEEVYIEAYVTKLWFNDMWRDRQGATPAS